VRPEHARQLFKYHQLFEQSCRLFEFARDVLEQAIGIPIPFASPSDISLSFWFYFKDYPPSRQEISLIHSVRFLALRDELHANQELISEFHLRRWYHICVTVME
jgi:hypothetical protein